MITAITSIAALVLLAWVIAAQVEIHLMRRDFDHERERYQSRVDTLTEALVRDAGKQLSFRPATTAREILHNKTNAFAHMRRDSIATPPTMPKGNG